MASPQLENGYTAIANEIIEELWKINLSPYESRVLWYIFRKTYGWKKKTDWIPLSQFAKAINLDRRLIHRSIKSLSSKKMIVISKDDSNRVSYGINKNYKQWQVSSPKMTVISKDDKVSSVKMTKLSSLKIPSKETTKETIQKKYSEESKEVQFSNLLLDLIRERRKSFKQPDIQKWADEINKMIRIDKRSPDEIEKIIKWCQANDFWQNNILSTNKLRKQFDQLVLKAGCQVKEVNGWDNL